MNTQAEVFRPAIRSEVALNATQQHDGICWCCGAEHE